jgi:hypothetical protein
MANQVGMVDIGQVRVGLGRIQVRVSLIKAESKIGLSVAFGECHPNTMFRFMLHPPETHGLADRLLDIASRLSNSLALQVPLIKRSCSAGQGEHLRPR